MDTLMQRGTVTLHRLPPLGLDDGSGSESVDVTVLQQTVTFGDDRGFRFPVTVLFWEDLGKPERINVTVEPA